MPSSPIVKNETNDKGFMPDRYAFRYGIYIVPHSTPAPRAAAIPRVAAWAEIWLADARANNKPPKNISAAPPHTAVQRLQPAPFNSSKNSTPQRIPMRVFVFQRGNAILRPRSLMAKMVSVLATDHKQPAMIAQMTRCGALRISARIPEVPRAASGRLQRPRNTPSTITKEMRTGEMPAETSLVGASAAPSQAPAAMPQSTPSRCNDRTRSAEASTGSVAERVPVDIN